MRFYGNSDYSFEIKYNFYNSSKERELLTCWQIQKPIRMQKVDENQKHLNACNFHSSTSTCAQMHKIAKLKFILIIRYFNKKHKIKLFCCIMSSL